jgi:hypothetical protein
MANWCSNFIQTDNEDVIDVFNYLAKKEQQEGHGQTLDYFADDRFLFSIVVEDGHISCETKWAPPIDTILNLSKRFDCRVELDYDEPGCLLFGKYIADKGEETAYFLTDKDFDLFEYDEDKNSYMFEEQEWESDSDIKELLLERKMNGH